MADTERYQASAGNKTPKLTVSLSPGQISDQQPDLGGWDFATGCLLSQSQPSLAGAATVTAQLQAGRPTALVAGRGNSACSLALTSCCHGVDKFQGSHTHRNLSKGSRAGLLQPLTPSSVSSPDPNPVLGLSKKHSDMIYKNITMVLSPFHISCRISLSSSGRKQDCKPL